MLADVYWIRAIQYFAATRLKDKPTGPRDLLFPLLDITTSLDPAFNLAYRFGAIFLAERHRGGTFQPELAIKLLDKGFAQNPTRWEYLYDKAFVYYWTFRDPKAAAHWFGEAAKVPGSADWLPGLAAIMLVEGGDRRSSRFMFQQMLQTAEHEYHAEQRGVPPGAARHPGSRSTSSTPSSTATSRSPARARRPGRPWSRAIGCARCPPTRTASPSSIDSSGRAALDPASKFNPLPDRAGVDTAGAGRRRRARAEASRVSDLTFAAPIGLLGLFVGSFLNVCIYRLPLGRTVLWGRSHCPQCNRQIRAWENVPVVSWLALARPLRRVQSAHLDAVSGHRAGRRAACSPAEPGCMARRCCWWPG